MSIRIPRDLSGKDLIKLLEQYGYEITRQTGSHIRITIKQSGEHNITIPDHSPLKIGTLNGILNDIAAHFRLEKEEIKKKYKLKLSSLDKLRFKKYT